MTDFNIPEESIRDLIRELVRKQNTTQDQIQATQDQIFSTQEQIFSTQQQLSSLTNDVNQILASNTFNNDVLTEMRENQARHQQNFEEHQRSNTALLDSLKAILLQLTRVDRNGS